MKNHFFNLKGFTLTEFVIALLIMGLLLMIGVPTLHHYLHHQTLEKNTESLRQLALLCEKNSLIYQQPIILCPTTDYQSCSTSLNASGILAFIDKNEDAKLSSPDNLLGTLDFSDENNSVKYQGFPYQNRMHVFSPNNRISSNGTFSIRSAETREVYFVRINKAGAVQVGYQ
jgi:type IV fimbrial biogenesis protein FimT